MIAREIAPLLAFRVGAARAALPLDLVREVVDRPSIVPVPGSHAHVAGIMLSRGVAVAVYDLRTFGPFWTRPGEAAQSEGEREDGTHLIVCGFGEILVGLLCRQADLLGDPEIDMGAAGPEVIRRDFVCGVLRSGEDRVVLLDPSRLFPSLGVPAERLGIAREDDGEEDPSGR